MTEQVVERIDDSLAVGRGGARPAAGRDRPLDWNGPPLISEQAGHGILSDASFDLPTRLLSQAWPLDSVRGKIIEVNGTPPS